MRITKRQLRRIIKEEKRKLINEVNPLDDLRDRMQGMKGHSKNTSDWVEMLGQLIDQDLTERGLWYEDEGVEIVEALEMLRREIKDEMRGPSR